MSWNFPDEFIPVLAIVCTFSFLTISTVVYYGYKAFCFSRLTHLKERLLESGMTSGEIERIVNAGTPTSECGDFIPQKKTA